MINIPPELANPLNKTLFEEIQWDIEDNVINNNILQ